MKRRLVDVNVLVAAASRDHVHNEVALGWVEGCSRGEIVVCRLVTLSFLRLLTNPRVMAEKTLTPREAWNELEAVLGNPRCRLETEPRGVMELMKAWTASRPMGGASWTDAYMAAFAACAGLRVATLDRGLLQYPVEAEVIT